MLLVRKTWLSRVLPGQRATTLLNMPSNQVIFLLRLNLGPPQMFWFVYEFYLRFSLGILAIAKSLLTFMVADTLYIDGMKTFSVDIVVFILCRCL